MKKVLSFVLALVLCVSLFGCGGEPAGTTASTAAPTETEPTVWTVPEPEYFVQEHDISVGENAPDYILGWHVIGRYLDGRSIYSNVIEPENNVYSDLSASVGQYSGGAFSVAKYYGEEGKGLHDYATYVSVELNETPLPLFYDYVELASALGHIDAWDSFDLPANGKHDDNRKLVAQSLYEKYRGCKVVSCALSFDWGDVDADLFKETNHVGGNIGLQLVDKYTGKAFSPGYGSFLADQQIQWQDKTYNIAVICTNASLYKDQVLHTEITLSAIVPMEYDGAVFAVGDGWFNPGEENEVFDYKDGKLFKDSNTKYFAYTPVQAAAVYGAELAEATRSIYSGTAPQADALAENTDVEIYKLEGRGYSTYGLNIEETQDGKLYVTNCSVEYSEPYNVSLILTDANCKVLGQTGLIGKNQSLVGSEIAKNALSISHKYAVVFYADDGSVLMVKWLDFK